MQYKQIKNILVLFIVIASFITSYTCYAEDVINKQDDANAIKDKSFLVIVSYSSENDWENDVLNGIKDVVGYNNKVRAEYLDSDAFASEEYYSEFLELLNLKYNKSNIDCIITIDDEALLFVKDNLFNENSFLYKKPVFFLGVNQNITFAPEDKSYMSGIVDIQYGMTSIDLINNVSPKAADIYLVFDQSSYCQSLKDTISEDYMKGDRKVAIHDITVSNLSELEKGLEGIVSTPHAFLLSGTFLTSEGKTADPADVIDIINKASRFPIYTTLNEYLENGAVGGIINDGYKLGVMGAKSLSTIVANNSFDEKFILTPSSDYIDTCIIDYKVMRKYRLNPMKLPDGTIFVNKGAFSLAFPMYIIYLLWILGIGIALAIIFLAISSVHHKRNAFKTHLQLIASQEREDIKTNFIIVMSHELRTPLNIIMNTSKLLKIRCINEDIDPQYFSEKLDYININSNRLLKSIRDSIDAAKLDSGVVNTNFRMLNIVEVIENTISSISELAQSYNIEIIFDTDEEEIVMALDEEKIERVILNLLANAVKFITNEGSILVNCKRDDSSVYISIEDNGIGMSKEAQKHIFEKFFQTSSSNSLERKFEGNGLGLYITKSLIDLHNGEISVDSTIGVGTRFDISLPIQVVDQETDRLPVMTDGIENLVKLEFADIMKNKRKP